MDLRNYPPKIDSSNYKISGYVKEKGADNFIKGISVNNILTDKNGYYEIYIKEYSDYVIFRYEDIDGVENGGEFLSKEIKISDFNTREDGIKEAFVNVELEKK
ncbi:MAG TPA: hypothetical protein PLE45_04920 [Spirochaetota bacterium]|nr:hypothetical protein [Spirochaetota bacterium]HOL57380.1 hypothetical protein [Spirochaetota bacterium]HPP03876.1 hypothetical protein [Spirochaetota bacterium]